MSPPKPAAVVAVVAYTVIKNSSKSLDAIFVSMRLGGQSFHEMSKTMNSTDSPGWATFRLRFRAFLIDAGICLGLFLVGGIAAAALFEGSPVGRVVAFFAIIACILSYEPFMLSRYGGTLGHTVLNLRVVQVQTHRNLPLWRGFVRTLTKMLFGIFPSYSCS